MKTREWRFMDKTAWGVGPWENEPDKVQWTDEATGMPCMIRRSPVTGAWCGYVGIGADHPLHGKDYNDVSADVHGGLTYGRECDDDPEHGICHVPDEGEADVLWWFGFDCAHGRDVIPAYVALPFFPVWPHSTYRTVDYVKAECVALARQLKEASWV